MLATSCSESLNILLKDTHELFITSLIDNIKRKISQWFFNRREKASNCVGNLTPYVKRNLIYINKKTRLYEIFPHSQIKMKV